MSSSPDVYPPDAVALVRAVCHVLGTSTPERVMQDTRGSPRDVFCRYVAMYLWWMETEPCRTYTAVGAAFNRDRSTVRAGIQRIQTLLRLRGARNALLRQIADIRALAYKP